MFWGRRASLGPPGAEQPAPQWGLLLDSRCERLPEASTPGCSPGSGNVLLWLRPLAPARCHLQMSPLRMSWMCCTMRLMATAGSHGRGHTGGVSCPPACPPSRHPRGTRFPPQASACHRASAGRPVPAGAGHNKIDLAWWRGFLLTNPGCNTSCQQGPPCQAVLRVFFFPHHLY